MALTQITTGGVDENINIDSNTLKVDGTNDRVGIGTSSPVEKLHVAGDVRIEDTSPRLGFHDSNSASLGNVSGGFETFDNSGNRSCFVGSIGIGGQVAIGTNNTERMRIDSSGNVGIGGSPTAPLHIKRTSGAAAIHLQSQDGVQASVVFGDTTDESRGRILYSNNNECLQFEVNNLQEAMRIDSSGNVGIGTTSIARGPLHINSSTTDTFLHVTNSSTGSSGSDGFTLHQLGNDTVLNNRESANMRFYTADTERMRITNGGILGLGTTSPEVLFHPSSTNNAHLSFEDARHPSYTNQIKTWRCGTNASSAWKFLNCESGCFGGTFDVEFILRGDGNAYADGSWNGGGADYAEYFEWSDGNTNAEDRRGISVVLDGDKIRKAVNGEEPIGVISGNPSVVGDAAWNHWTGKYVRDDYGSYVLDENGHRQIAAEYNSETKYVTREERLEWGCVGLMGKLRIRKGQVTGTRWIKMRDVSDTVEEWLVR